VTIVVDLDGVVWRGNEPVEGSPEAIAALRRSGHRVIFVTNNSSQPISAYLAKLASMGIPTDPEDVLSSAVAAARLLERGERALVSCAGEGVKEALANQGVILIEEGPADAVVVGWHRDFDFERLRRASLAVLGGARLIGTNEDPTYPTSEGLLPGGGAILAAVQTATGTTPVVAGKPHAPMAEALLERICDQVELVVGDRPSTDGRFAQRLGAPFGLVRSGVTAPGPVTDVPVAYDAANLSELVEKFLAEEA
jgi:glycerol 3-phosphatase-2